jgi:hypothetical protein
MSLYLESPSAEVDVGLATREEHTVCGIVSGAKDSGRTLSETPIAALLHFMTTASRGGWGETLRVALLLALLLGAVIGFAVALGPHIATTTLGAIGAGGVAGAASATSPPP